MMVFDWLVQKADQKRTALKLFIKTAKLEAKVELYLTREG